MHEYVRACVRACVRAGVTWLFRDVHVLFGNMLNIIIYNNNLIICLANPHVSLVRPKTSGTKPRG